MVIEERTSQWPIMVTSDEMRLLMFKEWLENSTYSCCTSVCEYMLNEQLILIIDCDVSQGRRDIVEWWEQ